MSPDAVSELFHEFLAAQAEGRDLDVRKLVERAGDESASLLKMIDAYLESAPTQPAVAESKEMIGSGLAGEPTLLALRTSRGRRVGEVVQRIVDRFRIDPAKTDRVQDYYQRLETGTLSPVGVDEGVFAAIAAALEVPVSRVLAWRPPEPEPPVDLLQAEPAMRSVEPLDEAPPGAAAERLDRPPTAPDEVDRIFGVG